MMKFKKTTRKRILISSLLVGILLLGAVISVVAVLAANIQNAKSNIKISYLVDGVAAKVSATYAIVPDDGAIVKTLMSGTTTGEEEIEFGVADSNLIEHLNPVSVTLTPSESKVVYEYKFTNLAQSAFTISLSEAPTTANMMVRYLVSATELDGELYRSDFSDTTLQVQPMTEQNQVLYVYISVEIDDSFEEAAYEGDVQWELLKAESDIVKTITLDHQNGTDSTEMKIIVKSDGVAMPMLYNIPSKTNSTFEGYYTSVSGTGTKYINSDGTSAHIADLEDGDVLYAYFSDYPYTLSEDGLTVTGLSTAGQTATEIVLSDGVTAIDDSAFSGATNLQTITIPASVETIGDSAFENCTALSIVNFAGTGEATAAYADETSQLISIGAKAFKGCSSLIEISIPEGVTQINSETFVNCESLTNLVLPTTVKSLADGILAGCNSLSRLECNSDAFTEGERSLTSSADDTIYFYISGFAILFGEYTLGMEWWQDTDDEGNVYDHYSYYPIAPVLPSSFDTMVFNSGTKIKISAFENCNGITSITIPDTVTSIGASAFENCSTLTDLIIPSIVTSIGSSAFNGLTNLTINCDTITLNQYQMSDSMKKLTLNCKNITLESKAFSNLTNLTELNWNVKTCNDFTADTAPFVGAGVNGNGISVNIGANVEKIPNYLFFGSSSNPMNANSAATTAKTLIPKITSLNFEEGVKTIGEFAFRYMYLVDDVYLPDSLEVLEGAAFKGATIKSIRFGKNLTEIGTKSASQQGQTFGWAQYLNKIIYDCENLTTIAGSQNLSSIGTKTSGVTVEIGSNVVAINSTILKKDNFTLTSLDFSDATNLKEIGANAFANNTSLTSIELPSNVEYVDSTAFSGCTGLSLTTTYNNGIYMANGSNSHYFLTGVSDSSVSSFSIADDCVVISKDALVSLTGISNLIIPDSVEIISDGALNGLSNLTSIVISENLRTIGAEAFSGLTSITTLTIPATVKSIGARAFKDLTSLQTLNYYAENVPDFASSDMPFYVSTRNHSVTVNIGSTVQNLPAYIFYASSSSNAIPIVTANIEEGVTIIGAYAFRYCDKLTSLTIPNSVIEIGENAFRGGIKIASLTIGENVESIGTYAFAYLYKVTTMNFNAKNITTIGTKVFENLGGQSTATNTCSIIIGSAVEKIPDAIFLNTTIYKVNSIDFSNATSLVEIGINAFNSSTFSLITSITIPDSVEIIGEKAFYNASFAEISVGRGVTEIGQLAFTYMHSLERFNFNAECAVITSGGSKTILQNSGDSTVGFEAVIGSAVVELPARLLHTTYVNSVNFDSATALVKLNNYSIYKNELLQELVLPDSVEYIGKCTLSMNRKLTSIFISKNVNFIDVCNTQFLDSLTSLVVDANNPYYYSSGNCVIEKATMTLVVGCNVSVIPQNDGILAIGECAFCRCDKLESVTIPSTVTTIIEGAFEYCHSLTSVTIPASVSYLQVAFNSCNNLISIEVDANNKTYYSENNCIVERLTKTLVQVITSSVVPDDIVNIGALAYKKAALSEVYISSLIETISANAFEDSTHKTVYVNNASVAMGLTASSAIGGLISSNVKTVYIASGLKVTDFIRSNFTLGSTTVDVDGVTYLVYTR